MKRINLEIFGLNKHNLIYKTKEDNIVIVKNRKSRIIMKDGNKLLEIADKIKEKIPNAKIELLTTAPICSKTKAFLEKNGIPTKQVDVL
ncbi:MAG: hypothetical protein ACE5D0_03930 [Fidelibacterota bacterium]